MEMRNDRHLDNPEGKSCCLKNASGIYPGDHSFIEMVAKCVPRTPLLVSFLVLIFSNELLLMAAKVWCWCFWARSCWKKSGLNHLFILHGPRWVRKFPRYDMTENQQSNILIICCLLGFKLILLPWSWSCSDRFGSIAVFPLHPVVLTTGPATKVPYGLNETFQSSWHF